MENLEKADILQDFQILQESYDQMYHTLILLEHLIEKATSEADLWELTYDVRNLSSLYTVNKEKIKRFQRDVVELYKKLDSIPDLEITEDKYQQIYKRLFEHAQSQTTQR